MVGSARRLSEADAWFLPMSEAIGMTTAGVAVTVHEGPFDPDLAAHYRQVYAGLLPAMRRRIVEDRWSTALPRWVDVPNDEPDDHWVTLDPPGDGTMRSILEWAAEWAAQPMPSDRSPWRAAYFDGVLVDGTPRTVTVRQMHHAVVDGGGAIRLADDFYRSGPDQAHPPIPPRPAPEHITAFERWKEGWALERSKAAAALRANGRRLRWARKEPRAAARRARELVKAGWRLQAPVGPVPMSPLLRGYEPRLRFDRIDLDLASTKAGARAAGGSVNDGLMAATSLALRRWHADQGVELPAVRTAMAVDRRPADSDSWEGNDALAVVVELPTDEDDLFQLIKRCADLSRRAREDDDALWLMDRARAAGNRMPRRLAVVLGRRSLSGLDVSISSVRGGPNELWEAGVRHLGDWGFIVGTLSPIAILASGAAGTLSLGITTSPGVLPEVEPLLDHLRRALDELTQLA